MNHDSCTDDEAIVFTLPFVPVYANPCVSDGSDRAPANSDVDDAYVNEARVVDVFENVLSAVKLFAVYVFGIVVEAAMYELMLLFSVVVSIVSAPPTLDSPAPSRLLNDEPFITRFVVDAVVNDPYVVDENANVCRAVHELALPRFREIVEFVPPSRAPSVPVTDRDELVASDDVAVE